jgi:anti-sigma factor RsiW
MMRQLDCELVRDQLASFHDGELGMDEQIAVEGHLRECVACAIESAEIAELGRLMRHMAAGLHDRGSVDEHVSALMLERVRVEERLSLRARLREIFEDMHLVWPAVGATTALLVSLLGALSVMQAANREHPESLAGMISTLAHVKATRAAEELAPRGPSGLLVPAATEDAVFDLTAAVTRGGRIASVEVLAAEQARVLGVRPEVVLAMLEAASRAQFVPAESRGTPGAVSMVFVLAQTPARGSRADYELVRVPNSRSPTARPAGPARTPPVGQRPSDPRPSAETSRPLASPATT